MRPHSAGSAASAAARRGRQRCRGNDAATSLASRRVGAGAGRADSHPDHSLSGCAALVGSPRRLNAPVVKTAGKSQRPRVTTCCSVVISDSAAVGRGCQGFACTARSAEASAFLPGAVWHRRSHSRYERSPNTTWSAVLDFRPATLMLTRHGLRVAGSRRIDARRRCAFPSIARQQNPPRGCGFARRHCDS